MSVPWGRIGGSVVGSLFGPGGTAIGGSIGGALDDSISDSKVPGIPTPPRTGSEQGQDYMGFMDSAYPGTTAWERLGANSPYGSVTSAETGAHSAQKMQDKELRNRTDVADSTNRAHIISSAIPFGPSGVQSALSTYTTRGVVPGGSYDTSVAQGRERLSPDISKVVSETVNNVKSGEILNSESAIKRELARLAPQLARSELIGRYVDMVSRAVGTVGGALVAGSIIGRGGRSSSAVGRPYPKRGSDV